MLIRFWQAEIFKGDSLETKRLKKKKKKASMRYYNAILSNFTKKLKYLCSQNPTYRVWGQRNIMSFGAIYSHLLVNWFLLYVRAVLEGVRWYTLYTSLFFKRLLIDLCFSTVHILPIAYTLGVFFSTTDYRLIVCS